MDHEDKSKKILTQLGREQAAVTGDRLKALNIKFNRMTVSTMVRAQETASIISEKLPDIPQEHCSLLREADLFSRQPKNRRSISKVHSSRITISNGRQLRPSCLSWQRYPIFCLQSITVPTGRLASNEYRQLWLNMANYSPQRKCIVTKFWRYRSFAT